jgi:tRNA-dihydrouridine synthase
VRLSAELTTMVKSDKSSVVVSMKTRTPVPDSHNPIDGDPEAPEWAEEYEELVLCNL